MSDDTPRGQDKMKDLDMEDMTKGPAAPSNMEVKDKDEAEKEVEKEGGGRDATKITVAIDPDVANKLRSAVYYTPGMTMWQIVQAGVKEVLAAMEEKHGEYPEFNKELKGGRMPENFS